MTAKRTKAISDKLKFINPYMLENFHHLYMMEDEILICVYTPTMTAHTEAKTQKDIDYILNTFVKFVQDRTGQINK